VIICDVPITFTLLICSLLFVVVVVVVVVVLRLRCCCISYYVGYPYIHVVRCSRLFVLVPGCLLLVTFSIPHILHVVPRSTFDCCCRLCGYLTPFVYVTFPVTFLVR